MNGRTDLESKTPLDVAALRRDFPILDQSVHGKPLVYLDSAASAQRPKVVIDAVTRLYEHDYANIHRGVHELSMRSTRQYEKTREIVRDFIGAANTREIVFVRGTTEAINLVAQSFLRPRLKSGDEIVITGIEHHSNIVPYQLLRDETGATLRVVPIADDGSLPLDAFEAALTERTVFCAFAHVSNALGTVLPVQEMVRMARDRGVPTLVDGAQAIPHTSVDVQAIGCDFYAFSGHKVYGPSGIGVLYGRESVLEAMPPWQGGGDMIKSVDFEETVFNDLPHKFEAGTPNIAGTIGLGAAIEYVEAVGMDRVAAHEADLLAYATEKLDAIDGLRLIGRAPHKAGVVSFVMDGIHPHDIGTILDQEGVAIRAGHHCAQPVMTRFGIAATARASFGLYNDRADIDRLVAAIRRTREIFGV